MKTKRSSDLIMAQNAIARFEARVTRIVNALPWVPVSVKLPPDNTLVFVRRSSQHNVIVAMRVTSWFCADVNAKSPVHVWVTHDRALLDQVNEWTPLP
jgi:hypothetical protein